MGVVKGRGVMCEPNRTVVFLGPDLLISSL